MYKIVKKRGIKIGGPHNEKIKKRFKKQLSEFTIDELYKFNDKLIINDKKKGF